MRDDSYKDLCLFGEELVSYIYGELPAAGRAAFEDHLLTCSVCVEEFAAVSESRLGVYEWHRDEFLPLETPVFELPYECPIVRPEPVFSWLDAWRGLLTPARLATAGGAFAVLTVAFWGSYISFTPSDQLAADVSSVPPVIGPILPAATASSGDTPKKIEANATISSEINHERADSREKKQFSRPVRAMAAPKAHVRQNQIRAQTPLPVKAPRLGTDDETEDTSLRLTDLVADIDTYEF